MLFNFKKNINFDSKNYIRKNRGKKYKYQFKSYSKLIRPIALKGKALLKVS